MKVVLLGLEFASDNLGCEALSYSFLSELKKTADTLNKQLSVVSIVFNDNVKEKNPEFDEPVEFIKTDYKSLKFWKKIKKLFRESDFIFDFTGGDSFSDIYGFKRYFLATLLKSLAIRSKTPFILGPQTYGPFNRKIVKSMAKYVIRKSHTVFARDDTSQKVAMKLSNREVLLASDVAFSLPYEMQGNKANDGKIRVGINPSGLLWNGGYSYAPIDLKVNFKDYCEKLLAYLTNDDQYEVFLIAHVGNENRDSDESDYSVCKLLHKEFPGSKLVKMSNTPMEIKSFISSLDVLIAARMHATIAAFSTGVATIPFSYSRKFEGLYGSLNYNYIVHAKTESTGDALQKTIGYIEERQKLCDSARESMKKVYMFNKSFEEKLLQILE